jgi:hypothetical protein
MCCSSGWRRAISTSSAPTTMSPPTSIIAASCGARRTSWVLQRRINWKLAVAVERKAHRVISRRYCACARYCRKSRRSNPETVAPAISKPAAATPISTIPVINNNAPANAVPISSSAITTPSGPGLAIRTCTTRSQPEAIQTLSEYLSRSLGGMISGSTGRDSAAGVGCCRITMLTTTPRYMWVESALVQMDRSDRDSPRSPSHLLGSRAQSYRARGLRSASRRRDLPIPELLIMLRQPRATLSARS